MAKRRRVGVSAFVDDEAADLDNEVEGAVNSEGEDEMSETLGDNG